MTHITTSGSLQTLYGLRAYLLDVTSPLGTGTVRLTQWTPDDPLSWEGVVTIAVRQDHGRPWTWTQYVGPGPLPALLEASSGLLTLLKPSQDQQGPSEATQG